MAIFKKIIISFFILLISAPLFASGNFLDYIYSIRPDHKQKGYSINTDQMEDGYSFGSGPYDGWRVEFFLFRGAKSDVVFEQVTGVEVLEFDKTYGVKLVSYRFRNNQKVQLKISEILPMKKIDQLFLEQTEVMKKKDQSNDELTYFRLIKFSKNSAPIKLKICRLKGSYVPESSVTCERVGVLEWNKSGSFILKAEKDSTPSNEII